MAKAGQAARLFLFPVWLKVLIDMVDLSLIFHEQDREI